MDDFYYKHIVEKLISTIDKIRMKKHGMVCTSLIMTKAQDITEMERENNKRAEEEQIKRMVFAMLLQKKLQKTGFPKILIQIRHPQLVQLKIW